MAGRKPKPTHLKIIAGNPGKKPLNKNEPKPEVDIHLKPPTRLKNKARLEWTRIAPVLSAAGLLTKADRNALALYCDQYAIYVDAMEKVNKVGSVIKGPNGIPVQSPFFRVANKATTNMAKMLVEFGMTPSSRSRVQIAPPEGAPASSWDDF